MKYRELIITEMVICLLLAIEIAIIASGAGLAAGVIAAIVAMFSVAMFVIKRSGVHVIAACANVGYGIAIGSGLVISTNFFHLGLLFGIAVGVATSLAQISLILTYIKGLI